MSWSGGGHGGSAGLATGPLSEMTQRGFLAWNGSPAAIGNTATVAVNQTLYVMKLFTAQTIPITNINVMVGTIATTPTAGQNLVTLYDSTGVKKGDSADQGTWTAGMRQIAVGGGPYTIPAGAFYVSILSNAGTPATFRVFAASSTGYNGSSTGALSGANLFWAVNGTAVTATANLTLGSSTTVGSLAYWVGVS